MIQATVAVYPLRQHSDAAVERALVARRISGVRCELRSMQSELIGPPEQMFAALRAAFEAAAAVGAVVMKVTVSNACSLPLS